jgi:serine/threonine-protein kinase
VSSQDDDPTIGATAAPTRAPSSGPGSLRTPSQGFAPGAIIAGRYRLVALLGRGGMGEVYRADDLILDHPVALKFLPAEVGADEARLAQFHAELRVARQVSHKNVCRLYDLGEADGRRFLTMEYVDGEDLASLLRRIGRVPQDKAVDIARQLCAGLAAAHERGVLHRDLKPANIMIDGDGNVRIADFGLAVVAGDGAVARAGTPHYMAPELLSGGQPSVKSDIYALGLVLFELFTGRRAYDAKTLNELIAQQQSGTISTPSSMVRDLDPAVERVILRCLERDPALRPGSALAVAAALPGGDPLAAALAAGETPSPELVAAAGETSAVRATIGLSLLALILFGLAGAAVLSDRVLLIAKIPLDKSVDVLEDRARDVVQRLGYGDRPASTARGLFVLPDYLTHIIRTDPSRNRWSSLTSGAFPTLRFWYRTSPRELLTFGDEWAPSFGDPPMTVSNMIAIVLDTQGRLTQLTVVPPQVDDTESHTATDWTVLFEAAGLPMQEFRAVEPRWIPNGYADQRAAWEGPLPGQPQIQVRAEAAAYQGRPVFFQIVGPWTRPTRQVQEPLTLMTRFIRFGEGLIIVLLLAGAFVLARHNLRSGRGDQRGATRVALVVLGALLAAWLLGARHTLDIQPEIVHFMVFLGHALVTAGVLWLAYVALEPYVRRFCPEILISWTRLIGGRLHDPLVGRDVLVGIAAGVVIALVRLGFFLLPPLFGAPPPAPRSIDPQFLLGTNNVLSALLRMIPNALRNAMLVTLLFVVMQMAVKRRWLAAVVTGVVFGFLGAGEMGVDQLPANIALAVVTTAVSMTTLLYFGVLAQAIAFLINFILGQGGLTADFSKLYATESAWLLLLVAGLAVFGYHASRASEPLFGTRFEGPSRASEVGGISRGR